MSAARQRKRSSAAERLAALDERTPDLEQFRQLEEKPDTRRMRSKRGIPRGAADFSQVCFKIERERHHKLKLHCVSEGIEIGEYMDDLLRRQGF